MFDKIRNRTFWVIDYLKGSKIKSHCNDLNFMLMNTLSHESIQRQKVYLNNILNHAVSTTKFYQQYKNYKSIEDFPIINKNQIRESFSDFGSKDFLKKKKHKVSTSGSTAAPFHVFQNMNKRYRHFADTIYFGEKVNFNLGEELIYIRIWPDKYRRSFTRNFHKVSVFALEDSDIENLLSTIRNCKSKIAMLGYVSSFEKICKYMDRMNVEPIRGKVSSIISMSERLNGYTRKSVKNYFDQTVISRYSNTEQGMIAQEELNNEGYFKINVASFYVEVFDLVSDELADHGSYGRIVVTDLFNYAMPLIRYDTGDIGKIELCKNEQGQMESYLTQIEGRKNDLIYNTKGEIVPTEIAYLMIKFGDFKQYQFVQCGEKEYVLKINTEKKVEKESELIAMYTSFLGDDADVRIEYVKGIPVLGSGKKKEALNTYKKPD